MSTPLTDFEATNGLSAYVERQFALFPGGAQGMRRRTAQVRNAVRLVFEGAARRD